MTKIKIIREPDLVGFENEIEKLLSKGWKMKGSICVSIDKFHYQMMVKKLAEDE